MHTNGFCLFCFLGFARRIFECRTESHRTKSYRHKVTDEKSQDKKSQFKFCILTKHIGQKVTGQKVTTWNFALFFVVFVFNSVYLFCPCCFYAYCLLLCNLCITMVFYLWFSGLSLWLVASVFVCRYPIVNNYTFLHHTL